MARFLFGLALLCVWQLGAAVPANGQPVIDGQLADLIAFADTVDHEITSCGSLAKDDSLDVVLGGGSFVPCAPLNGQYFPNGFDATALVLAYDRLGRTLYLGLRTIGQIGDTDGNGDPNASCPESNIADVPGIGPGDEYRFLVDTDCDEVGNVLIAVSHEQITVYGMAYEDASFAYLHVQGKELEIRITGADLPRRLSVRAEVRSNADGLSDDDAYVAAGNPGVPDFDLFLEAAAESIGIMQAVRCSMRVANPSGLVWHNLRLIAGLPPGLEYVSASTRCSEPLGEPGPDELGLAWPGLTLAAGQGVGLSFEIRRVTGGCPPFSWTAQALVRATLAPDCPGKPEEVEVLVPLGQIELHCLGGVLAGGSEVDRGGAISLRAAPNPSGGAVRLTFELGGEGERALDVAVHDASGRVVRHLAARRTVHGREEIVWDGRDDQGAPAGPGVYFVRAESGSARQTLPLVRVGR